MTYPPSVMGLCNALSNEHIPKMLHHKLLKINSLLDSNIGSTHEPTSC